MGHHNFDEARVTMTPLEYGKCPSRCNNSFVIFLSFFRLFFFLSFYTNIAVNGMWTKLGGTARRDSRCAYHDDGFDAGNERQLVPPASRISGRVTVDSR